MKTLAEQEKEQLLEIVSVFENFHASLNEMAIEDETYNDICDRAWVFSRDLAEFIGTK